ncbi:membrane protein [Duganella caerulea]|uniref:TPM domain-containing protein n=1 Tax=Duganella caerulea TaxID=2885762 RepID=UPI0030E8FA70
MDLARTIRHLLTSRRTAGHYFTAQGLAAIKAAIAESETAHLGEIRFAIEAALHPAQLWRDVTPRERAIELFSELRVWDTEHNSGVLIYVLLADHAIEIVADRGIHARVGGATWEAIAQAMQTEFAAGRFEAGALGGIAAVSRELVACLPAKAANPDELPNDVTLL